MIPLLLRAAAVLVAVFALTVTAILAQPREDDAMLAFFAAPDGCSAPCFLGIRPGVTTHDQAVALLRANPWVNLMDGGADGIAWTWNGQQPAFVSSYSNSFLLSHIEIADGVVQSIRIQTTTRWADFYFLFGKPDRIAFRAFATPSRLYRVSDAAYDARGFEVTISERCPIRSHEAAWYSNVLVTWPVSGAVQDSDARFLRGC